MKTNLFIIAAAALGFSFAAEAQTIAVGPRAGVNIATQSLPDFENDDAKEQAKEAIDYYTGTQFGAVLNYGINDMFSLQPELLYVQKGYQFDMSAFEGGVFPSGNHTIYRKHNYLEIPVLAKVSIGEGPFRGFATAGPTLSYLMSGKIVADGDNYEIDFHGQVNRFELGASVGIGVSYDMGPGALNFDVRYGHGFTNIDKNRGGGSVKNRGFGISLAYLFRVK
ncbi:PorT family protein [Pontibacter diazotrophicus]|uniref:PorT family protein n=1 Tax=Pontibacter diazotrophicus TaxID=1400979 RepID=A0A3D8LFJ8_9BACT|nr:porin family protein [Pontibacter diazotrophicus]RDV16221.1 PorT family protein [Pontibacter diazotrophicus]